ncbi:MAG TPA: hypothetical protein VNI54_01590 [Thermoanaerobaculia bacterium]|nr:hypothetical protein [Thermoanaerobaculia bacterium]
MRATVRLELRDEAGEIIGVRRAKNSVMKSGAEMLADLFTGKSTAAITHMGVGISGESEEGTFVRDTLTTAGDAPDALTGATDTTIAPADFTIKADPERRLVVVQCHATLPKSAAVGTLREAALLSRAGGEPVVTKLYNRVTFAPIRKQDDHELTMFWEVTFPYGDLNWL